MLHAIPIQSQRLTLVRDVAIGLVTIAFVGACGDHSKSSGPTQVPGPQEPTLSARLIKEFKPATSGSHTTALEYTYFARQLMDRDRRFVP